MVRRSRSRPGGLRSITVRVARDASRAGVFGAAALTRAGPRADFAVLLGFRARLPLRAVPALRALRAPPALPPLRGLLALLALAALRVRATAVFFRAALFLAVFRARVFPRVAPFFLVAAALRLAIALVLSGAGLP